MIVENLKTRNLYEVIGEAIMKDPGTRKWEPCIIYRNHKNLDTTTGEYIPVPDDQKLTFVRVKSEFVTKNEPCIEQ